MKIIRIIMYSITSFCIIGTIGSLSFVSFDSSGFIVELFLIVAFVSLSRWLYKHREKSFRQLFSPLVRPAINFVRISSYILAGFGLVMSVLQWIFRDEFRAYNEYYKNTPNVPHGGGDTPFGYVIFTVIMAIISSVVWRINRKMRDGGIDAAKVKSEKLAG